MALPYSYMDLWKYRCNRFVMKTLYGEKALGCPQYPFDSSPKDSKWWNEYWENQPYRDRASKTNATLLRAFSLIGGVVVVRRLCK